MFHFRTTFLLIFLASSTTRAIAGANSPVLVLAPLACDTDALFRIRGGNLQSEVHNIVENQAPGGSLAACLLAGGICGASDMVAQLVAPAPPLPASEKNNANKKKHIISLRRAGGSAVVGLLTLGLVAPAFYDVMKSQFPSGTTEHFLMKLFIGNFIYGSIVAIAYYIAAVATKNTTSSSFTRSLMTKIKHDLPKFIGFGAVFWGLVYPHHEKITIIIPFFIWTTLLSMNAYA